MTIEWSLQKRSIADLKEYNRNPRRISKAMFAKLKENIQEFGVIDRPCVNTDNMLIGGHQRKKIFKDLNIKEIDVWVPSRTLSEQEVKVLNMKLNKLSGEFDIDMVANLFSDEELKNTGWEPEEMGGFFSEEKTAPLEEKEIEKPKYEVNPGDLFELDNHRLLCGDATNEEEIKRLLNGAVPILMVTDPPYGVNYEPEFRLKINPKTSSKTNFTTDHKANIRKVSNDDMANWIKAYNLFPGDVIYLWHSAKSSHIFAQNLIDCGFEIISQIIWAKHALAISRGDYHWKHEPCFYAVRKGKKHNWQGSRKENTLWEIESLQPIGKKIPKHLWGRPNPNYKPDRTIHSTQKPIDCMRRPIINNTAIGESVYDPFIGSGTTLIAAEMEKRICYGIDIDPMYCSVVLERYENYKKDKGENFTIKKVSKGAKK
ncbi:MAG: DNA modification methylase [Candidatus Thorarchaeota archaeon]